MSGTAQLPSNESSGSTSQAFSSPVPSPTTASHSTSHALGENQEAGSSQLHHRKRGQTHDSGYYHKFFVEGAHKKQVSRSKWFTTPVKGTEEMWMHEEDEATEWLSLFYAVLTIFSNSHELATPTAIPIFLSFFVIIFWLWVSQTNYDMRYQGNDGLNRLFKFAQICLFIYQGAASGNWNPGQIQLVLDDVGDFQGRSATIHEDALTSWLTVTVAFAGSRFLLAIQYLICIFQAKKANRRTKHMWITLASLIVSLVLAIVSASIPSTSWSLKAAKIFIFYAGIVIEVFDQFIQILLKVSVPVETHKIAERYGAFTIIILGEGIISVTRAFNRAISGFSERDSSTYVQVFLTVLILYLLWAFLFSNFDKRDHTGHGRAVLWQIVHFPLCFGILLLVAAMVNVIITLSSAYGVTLVLSNVSELAVNVTTPGTPLDPRILRETSKYVNKLSLEPSFSDQMSFINDLSEQHPPSDDPYIIFDQYFAQVVYAAFRHYGVEVGEEARHLFTELYAIDTTWMADNSTRSHLQDEADHLFTEMTSDILNEAFTGVLWLMPVSGGVLILTAIRSMLWYHFKGPAHWIVHAPQVVFGVCLGLLGLLDIGNRHVDISGVSSITTYNPLYRIIFHEVPLVIVALVYFVVFAMSHGLLWFFERRRQRQEKGKVPSGETGGDRHAAVEGDREKEHGGANEKNGEASSSGAHGAQPEGTGLGYHR